MQDKVYLYEATIQYRSGAYRAQLVSTEVLKPGNVIPCKVCSGYIATAIIKTRLDKVPPAGHRYATHIVSAADGMIINNNTNYEEDEEMTVGNELFDVLLVQNHRGFVSECKALATSPEGLGSLVGRKVVYEGGDDRMHVGEVIEVIPRGTKRTCKDVQPGKFFVQVVDTDEYDWAKKYQAEYYDTIKKLKDRKKKLEERAIWDMLAKQDDEAKELLTKLDQMSGGTFNGNI